MNFNFYEMRIRKIVFNIYKLFKKLNGFIIVYDIIKEDSF